MSHRPEHTPQELTTIPHWIVYELNPRPDGKKARKEPYTPGTTAKAKVNDSRTWRTYAEALADAERTGRLPALVITPTLNLTLTDIDGQRSHSLVDALDSYTERSTSGTGLHILTWGRPPAGFVAPPGIEVYPRHGNRGVIITGDLVGNRGTIHDRPAELAELYPARPATTPIAPELEPEDELIIARVLRMEKGRQLHGAGDMSGYRSGSEADLGLLNTYVTAGATTPDQLDRLFRDSTLYPRRRERWDDNRYRERTLAKALDGSVRPWPGWSTPPLRTAQPPKNGVDTGNPHLAGFLADAPDPTPCQLRVAALERENVALRAQLAATEERARAAEARAAMLAEVQSRTAAIIRNKQLGQERVTAVVIAHHLANRETAGDTGDRGLHPIPLARIAEAAGISEDAASKHIGKLAEAGVLKKELRFIPEAVDRATGEIKPAHRRQFIGPASGNVIDFVTAVAQLDPEKPKNWGGRRTACPDHPDAGTVKKWTIHCAECDRVLERGADPVKPAAENVALAPNPHLAEYPGADPGNLTPAVDTTLRGRKRPSYHNNEDLAATGTDGPPRPPAPRYDDVGTSVAAAWQRGQPLPGCEPTPLDHLTDVAYGARR
ncbi:MAG: hypothetical protein H0V24_03935 [Chloroflexia bacterium]|nr:hypothetical protein [Chloroflexia bacterium]